MLAVRGNSDAAGAEEKTKDKRGKQRKAPRRKNYWQSVTSCNRSLKIESRDEISVLRSKIALVKILVRIKFRLNKWDNVKIWTRN